MPRTGTVRRRGDIGRPQQAIVRVVADGGFTGSVLGAGYGTGENALHVASRGLPQSKIVVDQDGHVTQPSIDEYSGCDPRG